MKQFVMILAFLLFSVKGFSTPQAQDYLIFNDDTLRLYESPLEQIDNISHNIRQYIAKDSDIITISSDCWRGFYAIWKVKDNTLYLSKVFDCGTGKEINAIIEKILERRFTNGLLKADWVNGTFWCGKNLVPEKSLLFSVYKDEYKLLIEKGKIIKKEIFHSDKNAIELESNITNEDEDYTYDFLVDAPPLFDGKRIEEGFHEYVNKNLTFPRELAETTIVGRVYVTFIIEKDGALNNAKVIRGIHPLLDAEALRVINASPQWTPAKLRDEPVRVKYVFPVIFSLNY